MVARWSLSWQMPQAAANSSLPVLPRVGSTWQRAQSPWNTIWRLAMAICWLRMRCISGLSGITTFTVNCLGTLLLKKTVMVLNNVPDLPRRSTDTLILPSSCGLSTQGWLGSRATVQPQEVWTRSMVTSDGEIFVTLKKKSAEACPGVVCCSFMSASHDTGSAVGAISTCTGGGGLVEDARVMPGASRQTAIKTIRPGQKRLACIKL